MSSHRPLRDALILLCALGGCASTAPAPSTAAPASTAPASGPPAETSSSTSTVTAETNPLPPEPPTDASAPLLTQTPPPAPPTPEPATAARPRAPAARTVSTYTGPAPCKHALKGDSPIVRACAEGGIASAKATMKKLVKDGRAAGMKLTCESCHASEQDFSKLQKDAHGKLDRLLAAVGTK
jgi:hypothetical protein